MRTKFTHLTPSIGDQVVLSCGTVVEVISRMRNNIVIRDSSSVQRKVSYNSLIIGKTDWKNQSADKFDVKLHATNIRSEVDGFYNILSVDLTDRTCVIKWDDSGDTDVVTIFQGANGLVGARDRIPAHRAEEHYVYAAYYNDSIYYIGHGSGTRYMHVNSGISSSYDLNRYHFEGVDFDVVILRHKMSKEGAVDLEADLIKRHQPRCNRVGK